MQPTPYGIKRLPFPINRRTLLEQDDLFDFTEGDPENSDDCSWYVVQLTNEQRLKFTSGLLAGFDLIYPDEFVSLMQLWLQPTEFPNQFPPTAEGCTPVDICQLILDCIETTPELQQAIATYSVGSPISDTDGVNSGIAGENVLIENVGCDNDNLFGMTTGLVDLYNNLALDIIEALSASANTMGRLGDAIEAIPVVGELPVDDALQFVESFLDDIEQNYQAAYTVALRDEYRCDLFCLAQDGCELTFTDIFNYFNDRLVTSIILIDFQDLAEYMTNGLFSGEELVHAFHAFVAGVFMLGGNILGIDSGKLINMVSALFNDPDSDWSILCDTCLWTSVLDLTTDDYGFIFDTDDNTDPVGEWQDGVGLVAIPVVISSADRRQLSGSWDFDTSTVTSLRLEGSFTRGTIPGFAETYVCIRGQYELVDVGVGTDVTRQYNNYTVGVPTALDRSESGYSVSADELFLFVRAAIQANNGAGTIHTITITGEGTKPSQLP